MGHGETPQELPNSPPLPFLPNVQQISESSISIKWNDLNLSKFGIYGTLYLLLADTLLYPVDVFTTRLQADKFSSQKGLNLSRLIRATVRKEGLRGIYRGFLPALVGSIPGQCIYYTAYEYTNSAMLRHLQKYDLSPMLTEISAHAVGGFTADALSAFVFLPSDIVAQRLQIERNLSFLHHSFRFHGSRDIIRHIWKQEGPLGFYRGYSAYLAVYGTASAVWWTIYENAKLYGYQKLSRLEENSYIPMIPLKLQMCQLVAGAVAGFVSILATSPLDVARTRLLLLECKDPAERKMIESGFLNILSTTYKKEGIRGFYKGVKPRLYIRIPGSSLKFLGYEALKRLSMEDAQPDED